MAGEPESLHTKEPLKQRTIRHDYDRLLMLSDGVFAIAITLLALDLTLPVHWDGSLEGLASATGRPLIGYLFGFVLVGARSRKWSRSTALLRYSTFFCSDWSD
jgi:biotin transporter BioY